MDNTKPSNKSGRLLKAQKSQRLQSSNKNQTTTKRVTRSAKVTSIITKLSLRKSNYLIGNTMSGYGKNQNSLSATVNKKDVSGRPHKSKVKKKDVGNERQVSIASINHVIHAQSSSFVVNSVKINLNSAKSFILPKKQFNFKISLSTFCFTGQQPNIT